MGSTSTLTEELTVGSLKYWFALASSLKDLEALGDHSRHARPRRTLCIAFMKHQLVPKETQHLHFLPRLLLSLS